MDATFFAPALLATAVLTMPLFKQVKLTTPESVELEFTLAGIGSRALALLIDYHLLGVGLVGFWILWIIFANRLMTYLSRLEINYSQVPLWLLAIGLLISFIVYSGYFVYFEVVWQGQTPGKRFAKIRVIQDDGKPVGLSQAALRALLRPIDDILFIGVFFIFFGQQEKRIGDWVAGTLSVPPPSGHVQEILLSGPTHFEFRGLLRG
ncbi:RDD family protein [Leptolyngbya sp. 7M]|uniref:RDD family protein n=1 Tax=Leptolyngbya sp. 7M TaxID=2812896 RepID=UPI0021F0FE27|nr:RDD family protein [Leptolyngbya sp. 7M]